MRLTVPFLVLAATGLLSGCHALREDTCFDKQPYQNAKPGTPLHAVDGLTPPNNKNALKIPDNVAPAPARTPAQGCLDRPPSFIVPKATPPAAK